MVPPTGGQVFRYPGIWGTSHSKHHMFTYLLFFMCERECRCRTPAPACVRSSEESLALSFQHVGSSTQPYLPPCLSFPSFLPYLVVYAGLKLSIELKLTLNSELVSLLSVPLKYFSLFLNNLLHLCVCIHVCMDSCYGVCVVRE